MNISIHNYPSIEQMTDQLRSNSKISDTRNGDGISFEEVLRSKQETNEVTELKFSKHANERLASRNIDLSDEQLERLEEGAKKASQKGIQDSLVMVDDLAFIVSIKNHTVVTALNDSDEKIFTNIDGAVIV